MSAPQFKVGDRVKMLPGCHYPPTRAPGGVRYGVVSGMTDHPGMCLVAEDRTNAAGEWAYTVEQTPGAGAMWWSEKKLLPIRQRVPVIVYHYRGPVERGTGKGYAWRTGYSPNADDGSPTYPWQTRRECQAEARALGCRAVFSNEKKP